MVGIAFNFDLGRYHGTAWRANVNEGTVEWPPSPWRVLRSLIASVLTDETLGDEQRQGSLAAIEKLARSSPPTYRLPRGVEAHSRHYFPSIGTGNPALVLDGFLAVDPGAVLAVLWDAELSTGECSALRVACSLVHYLGRSESLCTAKLVEGDAYDSVDAKPVTGDDLGGSSVIHLLAPARNVDDPISVLTASPDATRKQGLKRPPGSVEVAYSVPAVGLPRPRRTEHVEARPTIAVYRLQGGHVGMKQAVFLGNSLRGLIQKAHDSKGKGRRSPTFSGHSAADIRQDQHRHAHYLSLPGQNRRLIERLVIWAPEGFGAEEVETLARAARREIKIGSDGERASIGLVAVGEETSLELPELFGPSKSWESLTPFAMPRHPKRRGGRLVESLDEQLRQELALRSLAEGLVSITPIGGAWTEFRRQRPGRRKAGSNPAVGVRLEFDRPVPGPLSLGALSHFGLGLFRPDASSR